MSLEPGIDFGSYTPNVTVERLRCCREKYGVEWTSIGLQGNTYLNQQIEAALQAGMKVDTYLIPRSWYGDPVLLTSAQLSRITQYKGQIEPTIWFDVETLPNEEPGPATVLPYTATATGGIRAAGWEPAIYTSGSMWRTLTWDTTLYGDLPLWEALYGEHRPYQPFGGWTERAGVQWHGSAELCEMNVDLNTWERDQTMTDEQTKALIGAVLHQVGALGVKIDEGMNATNAAAELSGAKVTPKGVYFISGKSWPF